MAVTQSMGMIMVGYLVYAPLGAYPENLAET